MHRTCNEFFIQTYIVRVIELVIYVKDLKIERFGTICVKILFTSPFVNLLFIFIFIIIIVIV